MATPTESSEEENDENSDEGNVLEKEISELRSAKKELFEKARPINEELERIAHRERECVDKLHRITAEKHDREKRQKTMQRLSELESELKRLKCENDKLSDMNKKLKRSLDQAVKHSKMHLHKATEFKSTVKVAERELHLAKAQAQSEIHDSTVAVSELQKQLSETRKLLNETKEELNETRQRLSDVHERLTVAEQVTAATQQRELQEFDNSEELQRELTSQHQPTTHKGTLS